MFRAQAIVTEIRDRRAVLSLARRSMCGCCLNMFCGAKNQTEVTLDDPIGLCPADKVEVGIDSGVSLLLSSLMFLAPSLLFISVIYIAKEAGELSSLALALVSLGLYFILLKIAVIDRLKDKLSCRIIRRLS
ncbi:SoxR reducing system RseC family protein [Candidatus Omnitrophota bacterium]